MKRTDDYPLGYSAQEARRLADQAAQIEENTEYLLRRAGLTSGMQVLDIGCGVGDVSLLASKMVGSSGTVLGIDKAISSVQIARQRAMDLNAWNVHFEESDLAAFTPDRKFDALIGRFVLTYLADRVSVLRELIRYLNPGAIVAFLEMDMSQISQQPASELFTQVRKWVLDAFTAAGAELDMGTKLYGTFVEAGLPAPYMTAATPVVGGPNSPGYLHLVQALRSLMPVIERNGVADVAEIDIDTLEMRLREDAAAKNRVMFASRVVGAWAR